MSVHTAGIGVPEAMVVAGPVVEQFASRVFEYQFGDAMFDFISPWRQEQQEAFRQALVERLTQPAVERLQAVLDVLEGDAAQEMRRWQQACLNPS